MNKVAGAPPDSWPNGVTLLLTRACNLSCAYCYQDRRQAPEAMAWTTAQAALETLLGWGQTQVSVEFTGGEPLIEARTLRRAVEFVEEKRARDTVVNYTITTNGTLLTDQLTSFLLAHGFTIRLSFDGVEAAQRHRGENTFSVLDRLLDTLREGHPSGLEKQVRVVVTLLASTIPMLAESVRYLTAKGVQVIEIAPRFTWDRDWRSALRDELERQVDAIVHLSLDHWRRNGTVPVGFLARAPLLDAGAPVDDLLCGAPAGSALCVDPGGRAWACPAFAGSVLSPAPLALEASRALDLGLISARDFRRRLAALPERASRLRIFTHRLAKWSSLGKCADCRFVADCNVCPAAISHSVHNHDQDRISDFACAFKYVTLAARERFDEVTEGEASAAWYAQVRERLGRLDDLITAASDRKGPEPATARQAIHGTTLRAGRPGKRRGARRGTGASATTRKGGKPPRNGRLQ